jgi:hypothetical protein
MRGGRGVVVLAGRCLLRLCGLVGLVSWSGRVVEDDLLVVGG